MPVIVAAARLDRITSLIREKRFYPSASHYGITLADRVSNSNLLQAQIKQPMARICEEIILLTDHTKFGYLAYAIVDAVDLLDKVITEFGTRPEDRAGLVGRGIPVVVVDPVEEPASLS
jgi:DeoR/GlpR family transcriptional regulator of sugar metabolism